MNFRDFMKTKKPETVPQPGPSRYMGLYSPHMLNRAEFFLVMLFTYPTRIVAMLQFPREEDRLTQRIITWVFQEKPTLRLSIATVWAIYEPFFQRPIAGQFEASPVFHIETMMEDFQGAELMFGPGSPKEIKKEYLIQKDKKDLIFASKNEIREFIGKGEFDYRGSNYRF